MPRTISQSTSPDYVGLVEYLVAPFLDDPKSLHIDCETIKEGKKIWLRVAFDNTDKGKVFGRGGRNIQAIRTVIDTAAAVADCSVFLDIYSDEELKSASPKSQPRRGNDRPNGIERTEKHKPRSRYPKKN
jgi:predicted RNA-binding protein YlqC (UPF0109 family)